MGSPKWAVHASLLLLLAACSKPADSLPPVPKLQPAGSAARAEPVVAQQLPEPHRLPGKERPEGPVAMEPLLSDTFYWRIMVRWPSETPIPQRKAAVAALVRKHLPAYEVLPTSTRRSHEAPRLHTVELYDVDSVRMVQPNCVRAPCDVKPEAYAERTTALEIFGDTRDFGRTLHALVRLARDLKALPEGPHVATPVSEKLLAEEEWSGDVPNVTAASQRLLMERAAVGGGTIEEALALPVFHFEDRNFGPAALTHALAQRLLENPLPDAPGELVLDVDALQNARARERLRQLLGPSAPGKVTFRVSEARGSEPHRRTLALRFANGEKGPCEFFACGPDGKPRLPSPY